MQISRRLSYVPAMEAQPHVRTVDYTPITVRRPCDMSSPLRVLRENKTIKLFVWCVLAAATRTLAGQPRRDTRTHTRTNTHTHTHTQHYDVQRGRRRAERHPYGVCVRARVDGL